MIGRRRLLGGIGGLLVAGGAAWGLGRVALEAEIVAVLQRRLDYLKLQDAGVRHFARDETDAVFHKKVPSWNRLRYHFMPEARSFKRFLRAADTPSQRGRFEDNLIATYLLSSDFFRNGADESRLVTYVAYHDPWRACQNPFARPAVVA